MYSPMQMGMAGGGISPGMPVVLNGKHIRKSGELSRKMMNSETKGWSKAFVVVNSDEIAIYKSQVCIILFTFLVNVAAF